MNIEFSLSIFLVMRSRAIFRNIYFYYLSFGVCKWWNIFSSLTIFIWTSFSHAAWSSQKWCCFTVFSFYTSLPGESINRVYTTALVCSKHFRYDVATSLRMHVSQTVDIVDILFNIFTFIYSLLFWRTLINEVIFCILT